MICQPKPGQRARINYGDKTRSNLGIAKDDMPYHAFHGEIITVGRGIKNALVQFAAVLCVIPRGNLNEPK